MAGIGHFYVTAHGEYTTGPWVGEIAQCGLRWTAQTDGNPDPGPIINMPDLGPAQAVFIEDDATDWTVTRTFNMDFPGVGPQADWYSVSDDLASDMLAFLTAVKAQQVAGFSWKTIKVAPIERGTGKYLAPSTIYTLKAPVAGAGSSVAPPELSIAMSLRTNIVGKRGRGRMYLPGLSVSSINAADGRVSSAALTLLSTQLRLLVSGMKNLPGLDQAVPDVIICSAASTTCVIPHEVRVGDHFDVQRRRQHQVPENYTVLPIAP